MHVGGHTLPQISHSLSVAAAMQLFATLTLTGWRGEVAARIVKEVADRLRFLVDVGLDYLTLDRSAETLSGGEAQRIRLASQVGSGLTGVLYILDEPSIGLHQRDNQRLLGTLQRLRDLGNTVLVVEHDEEAILTADHVLDLGPGAGVHGGEIVAQGTPAEICANADSLTGRYLSGRESIPLPAQRRPRDPKRVIRIGGATANNLKDVSADFPLGLFTCVTGVSGSGKSTLVNDTLFAATCQHLGLVGHEPPKVAAVSGLEFIDRVIDIDQSPIGRTPRSNPATYTGLFAPLRELFAQVPEARTRGYDAGRFSFNVKGGRCEACQGDGVIRVEMHFLPDVYVPCDVCKGKRYNRETLEIRYRGQDHPRRARDDHRGCARVLPAGAADRHEAADADGRRPLLCATRPERDDAVRRRGAAREARARTGQARHRPHALHPRRADHRPALPRRGAAADACCTGCATRATPSS